MDGLPFDRNRLALFGVIGLAVVGAFALGRSQAEADPIVLRESPPQSAPNRFADIPSLPASAAGSSAPVEPGPGQPQVATKVSVHVVGEVKIPGIYEFQPDERVSDALSEAGGTTTNADLDAINLAAKLEDGSQLRVPKKGKTAEIAPLYSGTESAKTYSPAPKSGSSAKSGDPAPGSISLNSASASELDRLPGVGPSTAKKIMDYRQSHGGFTSIDELLAVKGIGPKKLADMRKYLRL